LNSISFAMSVRQSFGVSGGRGPAVNYEVLD